MNLRELIDTVRGEGYSQANAEVRVCQDIVLKAIDEKMCLICVIYPITLIVSVWNSA